jgi:hypothetical protein
MSKKRIILGSAVLIIVVLAALIVYSPSVCQCIEQQDNSDGAQEYQYIASRVLGFCSVRLICFFGFFGDYSQGLSAIATIVIAAFTATLWRATTRQWQASNAQTEILKQQMLLANRPLIRARDITFARELVVDEPVEVCLEFINIGAATAKIISSNVTILIKPIDVVPWRMFSRLPQPFDGELDTLEKWIREHHPHEPDPTIPAGQTLNMTKTTHLGLHPDDRKGVFDSGLLSVWVMGFVYYQDGTGQHRNMGFCYQAKKGFNYRFFDARDPDLSFQE